MIARRGFLGGLLAALAAPAIIRTPGLPMPAKAVLGEGMEFSGFYSEIPLGVLGTDLWAAIAQVDAMFNRISGFPRIGDGS